jgi:beta-galactosidase
MQATNPTEYCPVKTKSHILANVCRFKPRRGSWPFLLALLLTAIAVVTSARAADYTWAGGAGNWNAANWNPGPVSGPTTAGNTATITNGDVTVNVGGPGNVDSITLGSGATLNLYNGDGGIYAYQGLGNLILQGGTVNGGSAYYHQYGASMIGNLTVSGSAASAINCASWFNLMAPTTTFTVGDVTGDTNADLNVGASFRGDLYPGNDNATQNTTLVKAGAGTMRMTGASLHSHTTVNSGTLELAGSTSGYGRIGGTITVNSGATLSVTGGDGTGFGYQNGYKPTSLTINGGTVTSPETCHVWNWSGGLNMTGGTFASNGGVSDPDGSQFEWNYVSVTTSASPDTATIGGRIRIRNDGGYTGIAFSVADGEAATDLLVSAAITEASGGLGITKSGTGTMELAGTNTYTGNTTISSGTLGGNGSIKGPVIVQAGAALAPGASIGTLTISNTLTLAAGSQTVMEINAATGTNDFVRGLTTANYGGTLVITNLAGSVSVGQSFQLFSAAACTGNFSGIAGAPGMVWNFNPTNGVLTAITTTGLLISPISVSPSSNVFSGMGVTFAASASGISPLFYQWQFNNGGGYANVAGANTNTLALTATLTNAGWYQLVVTNIHGVVTSAPVSLTVTLDTNPPVALGAFNFGLTNVQVNFSKPLDAASATGLSNYAIAGGPAITGASLTPDGKSVLLVTAPLVYGNTYTLAINNVRDRAIPPNTIASNTTVSFSTSPRQRMLLDAGWRFQLGDPADVTTSVTVYPEIADLAKLQYISGTGSEAYLETVRPDPVATHAGENVSFVQTNFNDSGWRQLDLPHDWAVELPFDMSAHGGRGFKPLGDASFGANNFGWYRRTFTLPAGAAGQSSWLVFDGIFRNALIWINGRCIGRDVSGYAPIWFDVSTNLIAGGTNVLVVRVDASRSEGWFYEGAGIYRHVWLAMANPVHIPEWGTFVATTALAGSNATITIQTTVTNQSNVPTLNASLTSTILDANSNAVAAATVSFSLGAYQGSVVAQTLAVTNANLWSLKTPYLYKLASVVSNQAAPADFHGTPFGIRTVRFDSANGVFINNEHVWIQGMCVHQDHAGVGSALPDRLQYYRIERLKQMGVNAYRTAHNAPTAELLDACDQLGMLVMDETRRFGMDTESLGQLQRMVLRDRNHPSVFCWSLANEEWAMQGTGDGYTVVTAEQNLVHSLDSTRLCTAAVNSSYSPGGIISATDVKGFNYCLDQIDGFRGSNPGSYIIGTETASTVTDRGIYTNDATRGYVWGYDTAPIYGTARAEDWWPFYAARPWSSGGFCWTGFDYRGEPSPYSWPCINSHFGVMDTCGFPKDIFYYYQANWTLKPVLHLFPHWNWQTPGQPVNVWAFGNCQVVELFTNGVSLGKQSLNMQGHVEWSVPFAPGTLQAIGYNNGVAVITNTIPTVGAPAAIALVPDRDVILSDGRDVSVITVQVLDAQGRVMPTSSNLINFTVTGGSIIGVGNGDPSCHEADKASQRSVFNGLAQVIVQSTYAPGTISLTATSAGLASTNITIAKTASLPPPSAPAGVAAVGGNAQVALSWDIVPGAITYNLLRATTSGGPYTSVAANIANVNLGYTDSTVSNATTYYYVVTANGANGNGVSPHSAEVQVTPAPLVTGLMATAGFRQVVLNWNGFAGAHYNVKRSKVAGGPYQTIASLLTDANYADINVTLGQTYFYVVTVTNAGFESRPSAEVSAVAGPLHASALAYDGFAWGIIQGGSINGFTPNPAYSTGLSGSWSLLQNNGAYQVGRTSSTGWNSTQPGYLGLVRNGGTFNFLECTSWSLEQAQIALVNPVNLSVSGTYYMSFVASSGDFNYGAQIGLNNGTNELMWGNGYTGGSQGLAAHYGPISSATGGTLVGSSGISPTQAAGFNPILYVGRLTADGAGNVGVSIYAYDLTQPGSVPTSVGSATPLWSTTLTGVTGGNYNNLELELAGQSQYPGISQICLGTNWADVTMPLTCSVTYAGNGSTSGTAPTDGNSPYSQNTPATVLGNPGSLAKTGFNFGGWNTAADGSGTTYTAGSTFTITTNTTLYAKWVTGYTVTYDANGGINPPVDATDYSSGATVTVKGADSMSWASHIFAGWNTAADGSGTSYNPGNTFNVTSNTTLYAQWTVNAGQTFTWTGAQNSNWNETTANWTNNAGFITWYNNPTSPNSAVFDATGQDHTNVNVAFTSTLYASNVTFDAAGYTIGGNALTLGNTPTLTVNSNATISSVLQGSGGLTKTGNGALTLTAVSTYTGGTTVNEGTLALNSTTFDQCVIRGALTVNSGATVSIVGYDYAGLGRLGGANITTLNVNGGTVSNTIASWLTSAAVNLTGGAMNGGGTHHILNSSINSKASATTSTISSPLLVRKDYGSSDLSIDVEDGAATTDLLISGNIGQVFTAAVTKTGAGTLVLNGTNTYDGVTTVSAGTLGGTGSIAAPVIVQSGAALAPGASIGTLSISNTLTLQAGSQTLMEINAATGTNDVVRGVTTVNYGGTLVVTNVAGDVSAGQTFQLFSAANRTGNFSAITGVPGVTWSFNPTNGVLTAVTVVALNPTNLTASVSGTNLTLNWPGDHTGWTLIQQTNRLDSGVSVNMSDWMRVPGSAATNSLVIPILPGTPGGYYRLVYP